MDALGIDISNVDCCYGSEELGGLKPAPELFIRVGEVLKVEPKKILVVGDRTDTDGLGAYKAGMSFVQILKGRSGKTDDGFPEHPACFWQEFLEKI